MYGASRDFTYFSTTEYESMSRKKKENATTREMKMSSSTSSFPPSAASTSLRFIYRVETPLGT